jgi:hypothetical protein
VILKLKVACLGGTFSRIGALPTFCIVASYWTTLMTSALEHELRERFSETNLEKVTSTNSSLKGVK